MISGREVSSWYKLIKEIVADMKKGFGGERNARLSRYDELFRSIRFIHIDYIEMFQIFADRVHLQTGTTVKKARRDFLKARQRHVNKRTIDKSDAIVLLSTTDDLDERRFLSSIVWYFCYQSSSEHVIFRRDALDQNIWHTLRENFPGTSWDSSSTYFWDEIAEIDDEYDLQERASRLQYCISNRFATVVQSYNELERHWRFNLPSVDSEFSKTAEDPKLR